MVNEKSKMYGVSKEQYLILHSKHYFMKLISILGGMGVLIIIPFFLFSCRKQDSIVNPQSNISTTVVQQSTAFIYNPFGIMCMPSAANENTKDMSTPALQYALTAQNGINLAVDYGVKYYRMQLYNDKWTNASTRAGFLYVYSQANLAGLKVLLNVNWYYTDSTPKPFPDAVAYGNFLKSVLDTLNAIQKKPELIVVENEEENSNRHVYDFTSTTTMHATQQKYIDQLTTATAICNSYTWWDGTVGVKVTNGGFTTRGITYNVWNWLKNEVPDTAAARTFARNAFSPAVYTDLYRKRMPSYLTMAIDMGKYFETAYKSIALSYMNLHWYEPARIRGWNMAKEKVTPWSLGISPDSLSPGVLDQVDAYFNAKFSQKMVAQETGQLTTSSVLNKFMTDKYLTRPYGFFDYACWYDGDSNSEYESKAMHNTTVVNGVDSYTKRSNGLSFENTNTILNQ